MMIVGTLRVRLLLREARSLKDKRQVVKSITERLRHHFNVSVAEVEEQDQRQTAVLGVALVTNDSHHAKTALGKIVEVLRSHPVAELIEQQMEVGSS
jgi:uncharacterized protein